MEAHERRRRRRRELLFFLAVEFLLFTGPFVLPTLQIAWYESRGIVPPARFGYVPWLMASGLVLLVAGLVWLMVRKK